MGAQDSGTTGRTPLIERRLIRAPLERVFSVWTEPSHLRQWWGPRGVTCSEAQVDLRVGGAYRLGNLMPDGQTVWIFGEFLEVEPPRKLVYTWLVGEPPDTSPPTQVTVRFEPRSEGTEVIVVHEQVTDPFRERTAAGWAGCLEKLAGFMAQSAPLR